MNTRQGSAPAGFPASPPGAHVLPLRAPEAAQAATAGSKAARLAQHRAGGLPVPDGFIITVAASSAYALGNGFDPHTPAARVLDGAIPDALAAAIRRALETLASDHVAVRSSALAEDLAGASFAGMYESVLDVPAGDLDAVLAAVRRVWASAHAARVASYGAGHVGGCAKMAILVQAMVRAEAAGVAFTADPVTGERGVTIVSAVRGVGERLVSGEASAEEWRVQGRRVERVRNDGVLDHGTVERVARLAESVASHAGAPQDIEWACLGGAVMLLQARPLTALPEAVRWEVPWGGWVRNFRLGEWIGDPVTPAFESWLLTGIEDAMHAHLDRVTGWRSANPKHLVVNGWYFYGLNLTEPRRYARLRSVLRIPLMLLKVVMNLRAWLALSPPTAFLGFDWSVREWRERLWPAHRRLVEDAEMAVTTVPVGELPAWIDRLAASVGRNFASVVGTGGYAAKAELPLALFWKRHLTAVPGSWLELVRSGDAAEPGPHDVQGLDWIKPTLGELRVEARRPDEATRARVVSQRDAVTERARAALADRPKLRRKLDRLVIEARRAHAVREEQARGMTLAWPALRVAIKRLGEHLVQAGVIAELVQVFFLEHREILEALAGRSPPLTAVAEERRARWRRQARLAPPLMLGRLPRLYEQVFRQVETIVHGDSGPGAGELRGFPGSPGRVTGPVKVLRNADEASRLAAGDILVAPVTTPAWTVAFVRAAAVVTDTGSIASHASIVAREYGIPAVVATGDATARLRDGQVVTVDGSRGVVLLVGATLEAQVDEPVAPTESARSRGGSDAVA